MLEMPSALPQALLDGDRSRLAHALGNLLQNASQYTPKGGRIQIATELRQPEALIRVIDNGLGIAAEDLSRVFDLFVQVDNTLARSHGGLGVGLTLARRIVKMHSGTLTAASGGTGQGSIFTMALPIGSMPR